MTRLAWLSARAWMDSDQRHVWLTHECNEVQVETMLPDTWRAIDGTVRPSVNCLACGMHVFPLIGPSPLDALASAQENQQ